MIKDIVLNRLKNTKTSIPKNKNIMIERLKKEKQFYDNYVQKLIIHPHSNQSKK